LSAALRRGFSPITSRSRFGGSLIYAARLTAASSIMATCKRGSNWTDDNSVREQTDISPEEDTRLTEAEKAFRNLGAEMRAFANADRLAYRMVCGLGYDANQIAGALIAYSNSVSTYGQARFEAHTRLERLLRVESV
jgi:hypothetical protein